MARRVADPRRGRKPKAPAAVTTADDGRSYRSRPTLPGPFGDDEPPFEGTLAEVLERAKIDREAGMEPVIEYRLPGAPWMRWRRPLTVEDLARLGHAHQEEGKWKIDAEGERMLRAAERGQLPESMWPGSRR